MKPFLAVPLLLAAVATSADAATVTYAYTASLFGSVIESSGGGSDDPEQFAGTLGAIAAGFSTISGTLTFDVTPVGDFDGGSTIYAPAVVVVNEFILPGGLILIHTLVTDDMGDSLGGTFLVPIPDGPSAYVLPFFGGDDTALSGSQPFPDLAAVDWDGAGLSFRSQERLTGGAGGAFLRTDFVFDELSLVEEPAPIPLPAGAPLLVSALALLAATRRRPG